MKLTMPRTNNAVPVEKISQQVREDEMQSGLTRP